MNIFSRLNHSKTYGHLVSLLGGGLDKEEGYKKAIGGNFEAFGILLRALVIQSGLKPTDYFIDVGCGSGRLTKPLAEYLVKGKYLGTDVVPPLLEHARKLVKRRNWRFELTKGRGIPEKDGAADMVAFFSVFTHMLHEESYLYLLEAKRVLRPGGKIVFSFLEFRMPNHWKVFLTNIENLKSPEPLPLNMFMSRDLIEAFASKAGLAIETIYDGNVPFISIPHPITLDDGARIVDKGTINQSVCVLVRPEES